MSQLLKEKKAPRCRTIHEGIEVVTAHAVAMENQILELNEELIEARKQIQALEVARHIRNTEPSPGTTIIVLRMLTKINHLLEEIDGFHVLPVGIVQRLEIITVDALAVEVSEGAATAYTILANHVRGLQCPQFFTTLLQDFVDMVVLACCRHINPLCKLEFRESLELAFGGELDHDLNSKLGNSRHQLFHRNYITHPVQGPDHVHGPHHGHRIRRNGLSRRRTAPPQKRSTSEPVDEARLRTYQ